MTEVARLGVLGAGLTGPAVETNGSTSLAAKVAVKPSSVCLQQACCHYPEKWDESRRHRKEYKVRRLLVSMAATAAAFLLPICLIAQAGSAPPSPRSGSPEDNLPPNMTRLTWFGERASWSLDGKRIAFISKSFGDAFKVDLATRLLIVV